MRGDLAHDQQGEAGLQIGPAADAEGEQEPGSQAFGSHDARDQGERKRSDCPDSEEDDQRHGGSP